MTALQGLTAELGTFGDEADLLGEWESTDEMACGCAECAECAATPVHGEVTPVPAGSRPPIRATSTLRNAWREYRCATDRMVTTRLFGKWHSPVNPRTVDAWRALETSLAAAGYDVHRAWVYVCRNIASKHALSLHAYGLAIDIDHANPRCNVNNPTPDRGKVRFSTAPTKMERCRDVQRGTADTSFTPDQVAAVEAIRTIDGHQVFAWGGRWATTKDTMHFQINVTPQELARGIAAETVGAVKAAKPDEYASADLTSLVGDHLTTEGLFEDEQLSIPVGRPFATTNDLDSAVRSAFTTTGIAIIERSGAGYAVHQIRVPAASVPEPMVWNIVTVAGIHAVVLNGRMVYLPDPAGVGRWVQMPRMREFFGLPAATQGRQRSQWIKVLRNPGATLPPVDITRADSMLLRALLIWNAPHAFPVTAVHRTINGVKRDRGGVVEGATTPIPAIPLSEPDCYLPVISEAEGRLESINAWDAGAGLSLGPVQINAQRAALPRFLMSVWQNDAELFTRTLGPTTLGWAMRSHGDHPDLIATRGKKVITLHGRNADADVKRMIRYLHGGNPAKSGFDPDWRRRQAAALRSLLCWPHVQELLLQACTDWLGAGLAQIRRAGIGPLDPARPDGDTYVLTALLLSAYVRFSGCLPKLLHQLAKWPTATTKLAHWQTAVRALGDPCKQLIPRLTAQESTARRVHQELPISGRLTPGQTTIQEAATSEEAWGTVGTVLGGLAGGLLGGPVGAVAGGLAGHAWGAADHRATTDVPATPVPSSTPATPSSPPPAAAAPAEQRTVGPVAVPAECVAIPVLPPPDPPCPVGSAPSADRPLRMPAPGIGRFEGKPAITAFAADLAHCFAGRKAKTDADRARLTTNKADELAKDYAATLTAGLVRYGPGWKKKAQGAITKQEKELRRRNRGQLSADELAILEKERCRQEVWLAGRMDWLRTGWMVGRREEVDFQTLMPASIPALPHFLPPPLAAGTTPTLVPIEPEGTGTPITPEAKRFLVELRRRTSGFDASNYRRHGSRGFVDRGLSVDLMLRDRLDSRGFYPRDKAAAFLLTVDAAARAAGLRWRVLYNDFAVAAHINRLTRARHVLFIGQPGGNLNWHGPLILHFHIDLAP